ncbi:MULTISPECIES: DUF2997 domain-containing protein [unclassified Pseudoalteromonas]|uniref:DUF2997 domain-containing protein n=1 Tax=unclassified Pseudoalteromonas TaxID=194690 RepID=UPI0015F96702|nr:MULTISPECIES: DUF2997 domain-containing protein [unclassified Pseudoalteromonas]MBB1354241.1 DUF2997 domain-containing protein [Pseudoalteromonas sp. SR45-5]MBB1403802.1 DUF2997 domain-containing protein [Pseudoalteromonas sp. SG45-1]
MPEQQIIITIDEQGQVNAKTEGFQGDSCIDAVVDLLGEQINIKNLKKTDEYHQSQTVKAAHIVESKRGG